jgi:hypothetical protein
MMMEKPILKRVVFQTLRTYLLPPLPVDSGQFLESGDHDHQPHSRRLFGGTVPELYYGLLWNFAIIWTFVYGGG